MTPAKLNTASFLDHQRIIIPANGTTERACTGQIFRCTESTAKFKMAWDDAPFFPMEVGLGFRLEPGEGYSVLRFRNDTATAITVEFYWGLADVTDARLNTLVERNIAMLQKDAPCTIGGTGVTALGAGMVVDLTVGAGIIGKFLMVSNLDAANAVYLLDEAGLEFGAVQPKTTEIFPISGNCKIKNPSGAGVNVIIGRAVYNL